MYFEKIEFCDRSGFITLTKESRRYQPGERLSGERHLRKVFIACTPSPAMVSNLAQKAAPGGEFLPPSAVCIARLGLF
jgi:hypothetical protein